MIRIILQNNNLNLDSDKKQTITTGFISDRDILKKRSKNILISLHHLIQKHSRILKE